MDAITSLRRRNYWIAGISAIIALFSFFVFSFGTIHVGFAALNYDSSFSASDLASYAGVFWFEPVAAVAIIVLAGLFVFSKKPFSIASDTATQSRWTGLGLAILAALTCLFQIIAFGQINQHIQEVIGSAAGLGSSILGSSNSTTDLFHISVNWGFGAWVFVFFMLVIIAAGILEFRSPLRNEDGPVLPIGGFRNTLPYQADQASAPSSYSANPYQPSYGSQPQQTPPPPYESQPQQTPPPPYESQPPYQQEDQYRS